MDRTSANPRSGWTSIYTVIIFAMVGCIYLRLAPSLLTRPDLAFLEPIAMVIFSALLPLVPILRRRDQGTLTRGLLLFVIAVYVVIGAAGGIAVFAEIKDL